MRSSTLLACSVAVGLVQVAGAWMPFKRCAEHSSSSSIAATSTVAVEHSSSTSAVSVSGSAEGFATGVTGGGDATPVYPSDIDELVSYLQSDDPQVIILQQTFDFTGSEGTTTEDGCAPWGTDEGCQLAINANDWCGDDTVVTVTYDNAATTPIDVASNKTILGVGTSGIIKGKGLRFTSDVSNIIVQNIEITYLNPQYVWGGDALGFTGTSLVWIDHVTTSYVGRQHYVFGFEPSDSITLSNNFLNGQTNWSASCDGHQYWAMELVGDNDQITFKNNYVYYTSGRSPALSGTTLFHACNNVWEDNSGHAIEGDTNGMGLFEGNVFKNVSTVGDTTTFTAGQIFSSPDDTTNEICETYIGRSCVTNTLEDSGTFDFTDTAFMANLTSLTVADCSAASEIESTVPLSAGNTL